MFEGTRVFLVEIQALTVPAKSSMTRVYSDKIDSNRVSRVAAVLEKRTGLRFSDQDIYINVAGGIKVSEPAVDLGLVVAIISSYHNKPVKEDTAVFGEVGLSGEVRAIAQAEARVNEAKKLGFKKCILPASCKKSVPSIEGMELVFLENIKELKI